MTSAFVKKSSPKSSLKKKKSTKELKFVWSTFLFITRERKLFLEGYEINEEQLKPEVLHETSCGSQNNSNNKAKQKTSKQT